MPNRPTPLPKDFGTAQPTIFCQFLRRLRGLGSGALRADVDTRVSLPDPVITEEEIGFRDFPKAAPEQSELVALRVTRSIGASPGSLAVAHQTIGREAGQTQVLARAVPRAISDTLLHAARRSGFRVAVLEGLSRFLKPGAAGATPYAHITQAEGFWTLTVVDATRKLHAARRSGFRVAVLEGLSRFLKPGAAGATPYAHITQAEGFWTLTVVDATRKSRVWSEWQTGIPSAPEAAKIARPAKTFALARQTEGLGLFSMPATIFLTICPTP